MYQLLAYRLVAEHSFFLQHHSGSMFAAAIAMTQ